MNWYFYKVFLPLVVMWLAVLLGSMFGVLHLDWKIIFVSWFFMGPVGIGVGFHRLLSHRQFETWRPVELILAMLGTLAAYAPALFWVANHQFHHKKSDEPVDSSSPRWHGVWNSFLWARLRKNTLGNVDLKNYCSRRLLMDPKMRWMSKHFTKIFWVTIILLSFVSLDALTNIYLVPIFIEHFRVNLVSCASHLKVPFSYRNHKTSDDSYNNIVLGWLTFGFAWHNNHHWDERKLNLMEKWWEVDVEGLIGMLFRKQSTLSKSVDS